MSNTFKIQIQTKGGAWVTSEVPKTLQLTDHLQAYEVANQKCDSDIKLKIYQSSLLMLEGFEFLRTRKGKGITISDLNGNGGSGYREAAYNKKVGGVTNSLHLTFNAMDLQEGKVTDLQYKDWLRWVEEFALLHNCQAELGRYSWGLHVGFIDKLPFKFNGTVYEFVK